MHSKAVGYGRTCVIMGSSNLTHNSMERNREHCARTTDKHYIQDALKGFEATWVQSLVVDQEAIDLMRRRATEIKGKGKEISAPPGLPKSKAKTTASGRNAPKSMGKSGGGASYSM